MAHEEREEISDTLRRMSSLQPRPRRVEDTVTKEHASEVIQTRVDRAERELSNSADRRAQQPFDLRREKYGRSPEAVRARSREMRVEIVHRAAWSICKRGPVQRRPVAAPRDAVLWLVDTDAAPRSGLRARPRRELMRAAESAASARPTWSG